MRYWHRDKGIVVPIVIDIVVITVFVRIVIVIVVAIVIAIVNIAILVINDIVAENTCRRRRLVILVNRRTAEQ